MSYKTWTEYGYGICVSGIITTVSRVLELLAKAPKTEQWFNEQVKERFPDGNMSMEDIHQFDSFNDAAHGLAPIMRAVILEAENVDLYSCEDYRGDEYLILLPFYPWDDVTCETKALTKKTLEALIQKYVKILTDWPVEFGHQEIENGG